jgi:hypothetical protein
MATAQSAGADKVSSVNSTTASGLIRWGGPAAVLGSLLVVFGDFLSANNWMYTPVWGAGSAFMVVAITGIYLHLRRSGRIGLSGTVGFYMSIFAFMVIAIGSLGVLLSLWGAHWFETLEAVTLLIFLGTVMFGVAILRSGRLPRGGAWLIIAFVVAKVGVIVAMAVSGYTLPDVLWSLPLILFGLGWVWLGYGLWSESGASESGASDGQRSRVS